MGRKTNPNILRISTVTKAWEPKWFAERRPDYRQRLGHDLLIRKYLDQKLRMASISRVEISRDQKEVVLTIHTSRPAVVIGRGGSGVEKIQKDLVKIIGNSARIRINVQEIRNPDTDAAAMATQIVEQLERRMPFRRVLKQAVTRAMQAGAVGVRVSVAGRLNGAEIARSEWLSEGNVPLQTFRADVSFAKKTAFTSYGTIGIKVWINRGDLIKTEDEKPGESRQPGRAARRRKSSLADKASRSRKPAATGSRTGKREKQAVKPGN